MKLTATQLNLLASARLYGTEAGGVWYEHGQAGKAVPGLVKPGLVEFRRASGGVGNAAPPAMKRTAAGEAQADEYLADHREQVDATMQAKIQYVARNLRREGK